VTSSTSKLACAAVERTEAAYADALAKYRRDVAEVNEQTRGAVDKISRDALLWERLTTNGNDHAELPY
jgi:hypothetical protein